MRGCAVSERGGNGAVRCSPLRGREEEMRRSRELRHRYPVPFIPATVSSISSARLAGMGVIYLSVL